MINKLFNRGIQVHYDVVNIKKYVPIYIIFHS